MNQVIPIIINNPPRQVECIVQEGKKFCESIDMTSQELGFVILIIGGLAGYAALVFWISDRFFDLSGWVIFYGFAIPWVLLALGLIFL